MEPEIKKNITTVYNGQRNKRVFNNCVNYRFCTRPFTRSDNEINLNGSD